MTITAALPVAGGNVGDVYKYWPVAAVSFAVALLATPACRRIAHKLNIVDKPDAYLKPHERPIPYLGGVAIFLGWLAGIIIALTVVKTRADTWTTLGIALAGLLIMLVGLFDDLRAMSPKLKLVCNLAVAGLLLYIGVGRHIIEVVTDPLGVDIGPGQQWLIWLYSMPIAVFVIVGSCNATNLIDGLDGLCSGVLGIISLGFCLLAGFLVAHRPESAHYTSELMILSLAMLGGAVGFLPYNRNPATIFMGDAGSMLLGLNAAVIMLLFAEDKQISLMMAAFMVFGLPISDMLLTLARRWRNGRPLMEGDRSHFYDQLRDRGMSVQRVVTISYLLTLGFVAVGTSIVFGIRTRYAVLLYATWAVVIFWLIWRFNMASIDRAPPSATAATGEREPNRPTDEQASS